MEIREITSREKQDAFVGSQPQSQFLQSWRWGEFQRTQQNRVLRLGCISVGRIVGLAQVIEQRLPLRKKYWYLPRGPIVDLQLGPEQYRTLTRKLVEEIAMRATAEDVIFLKIEPPLEKHSGQLFGELVAEFSVKKTNHVQPQDTWTLDLGQNLDELREGMHPKTRYNIKLAEKKGLRLRSDFMLDDFDSFWKLISETTGRDSFRTHDKSYFREMMRLADGGKFLRLYTAEYQGAVIAANIVVSYGDTVTYLHGASSSQQRNLMAPHLLQWQQIADAKGGGYRQYDFWGIAPNDALAHPWAGISRFKKGFGGHPRSYLGAYDLILDPIWYRLYKTAKKLKF